jgi:8-oxo-dGTP pyrophosphatase MutT (NUDIX family)
VTAPRSRRRGPSGRRPTEYQHSAGGLVVRAGRVLLIATAAGRRWQLPKGHIEPGESIEQAAVREVREETGVDGRIRASLPSIDYFFVDKEGRRVRKHVDYFLLDYVAGDESDFDPHEVDDARWFEWQEALARLSHANERRVAEKGHQIDTGAGAESSTGNRGEDE